MKLQSPLLSLLAAGYLLFPAESGNAASGGRYFYLTDQDYSPAEATTACGSGYHMASLWEILDVSGMIYDHANPAAHVKADSGYGPPSGWYGWVRTGYSSSGANTAGTGNCLAWTSAGASAYGTAVRLSNAWQSAPGEIFSWDAASFNCSFTGPVWCVRDIPRFSWPMFLPAIIEGGRQ